MRSDVEIRIRNNKGNLPFPNCSTIQLYSWRNSLWNVCWMVLRKISAKTLVVGQKLKTMASELTFLFILTRLATVFAPTFPF